MEIDEELTKIEQCKVESMLSAFCLCLRVSDGRVTCARISDARECSWKLVLHSSAVQYQFPTALLLHIIVYSMVTWYKCTNDMRVYTVVIE